MLNQKQIEIVNGSLLGDGTIWTNFVDPLCKFQLGQSKLDNSGIDKKSYIGWLVSQFMIFGCSVRPRTIKPSGLLKHNFKKSQYEGYVFTTRCNELWSELEKKWYVPRDDHPHFRRKKVVPLDLCLTPLTLCVWHMEDGSTYTKDGNITLETQGFTEQEVDFLITRLQKDLQIKSHKKKAKENQFRIFVGTESFHHYIDTIKPHVSWDCFAYKIDDSYNKLTQIGENHSQAKLTEQQVQEITNARLAGRPVKELAVEYGVSKACISMATTRRWQHQTIKVPFKTKPRLDASKITEILNLRGQGMSQKMIADTLNIHQATVSRVLSNQDI
jgi:hypothetical protein